MMLLAGAGLAQNQLANPASQNCVKQGGALKIERRPDGGQYGVCVFTDSYQCEEWALFRGECPKNGLRVTSYVTPAGRYLRHHRRPLHGGDGECGRRDGRSARCRGGKACDAAAYYAGTCGR